MRIFPFLFLDSPRVGDIGHSFVVARGEGIPPEETLTRLASQARLFENGTALAARRRVTQMTRGMAREGDELLICGGAAPTRPEDGKVVLKFLAELLQGLPDGQLETDAQIGPLMHEARFMTELMRRFRNDARVAGIGWTASRESRAESLPVQQSPARPTLWARFRRLPMLMKLALPLLLIILGTIFGQKKEDNPPPGAGRKIKGELLDNWVKKKGHLKPLMKLTDPSLDKTLAELLEKKKERGGKWLSHNAQASAGEQDRFTMENDKEIAPVHNQILDWTKQIEEEFKLDNQTKTDFDKDLEAIMNAKGPDVAAWFRDTNNQRNNYTSPLQIKAKTLEEFADIFPSLPPVELPDKLRKLFAALVVFSKVPAGPGDEWKPFQELLGKEFLKITNAPSDYKVLTPKDAHRIEVLQKVLSSTEFSQIFLGEPLASVAPNWIKIRKRIDIGNSLAKTEWLKAAPANLLKELYTVFSHSPAPSPREKTP